MARKVKGYKAPNNTYNVRHVKQNYADFNSDIHRFVFEYNGKKYIVMCIGGITVEFNNYNLPSFVQDEVIEYVYYLMDTREHEWSASKQAYADADAYCHENFY